MGCRPCRGLSCFWGGSGCPAIAGPRLISVVPPGLSADWGRKPSAEALGYFRGRSYERGCFRGRALDLVAGGQSRVRDSFSTSNIRRSTLPAPSGAALRAALRAGYLTSSTLRSGSLRSIQHPRLRAGGPSPHVLANVATFRRLLPFHPFTPHLSRALSACTC
jgi:hypothetical protein